MSVNIISSINGEQVIQYIIVKTFIIYFTVYGNIYVDLNIHHYLITTFQSSVVQTNTELDILLCGLNMIITRCEHVHQSLIESHGRESLQCIQYMDTMYSIILERYSDFLNNRAMMAQSSNESGINSITNTIESTELIN